MTIELRQVTELNPVFRGMVAGHYALMRISPSLPEGRLWYLAQKFVRFLTDRSDRIHNLSEGMRLIEILSFWLPVAAQDPAYRLSASLGIKEPAVGYYSYRDKKEKFYPNPAKVENLYLK